MADKLITPEDIENHNKEGGAWAIVQGKVYDFKALAELAPCGAEKLLGYVGQDATQAFEAFKHSDLAYKMAMKFLKGTYSEVTIVGNYTILNFFFNLLSLYLSLSFLPPCFTYNSSPL